MPLPTPQQAAYARANQGFLGKVGHTLLTRTPYIGPAYNIGGTIAHMMNGTAGQYGPATTLLGRLLSAFSSNPTNAPRATLANPMGPVQPGYEANPQGPVDPSDPNNPLNQPALPPSAVQGPAALGGLPGPMSNNTAWNSWRSPGSQTYQQAMNPGSAIGPFGGGRVNAYNPSSTHGTPNSSIQGIPPGAAAFMSWVRSRNLP